MSNKTIKYTMDLTLAIESNEYHDIKEICEILDSIKELKAVSYISMNSNTGGVLSIKTDEEKE